MRMFLLGLSACLLAFPAAAKPLLTLERATALAVQNSPDLKAAGNVWDGALADVRQADVPPNPNVFFEAENIAGKDPYQGANGAEITAGFSQKIEMGGKRRARVHAASEDMKTAFLAYDLQKAALIRDVRIAYTDALAAARKIELAEAQKTKADRIHAEVSRRVKEARDPLMQQTKAGITQVDAELVRLEAETEYRAARERLQSLTGATEDASALDPAELETLAAPPDETAIEDAARTALLNHAAARAHAKSQAFLSLSEANAVPDPEISLGVRDFREEDAQAFIVGVSIPMPLFDRNKGAIAKARSEMARAENTAESQRRLLLQETRSAHRAMQTAHAQATAIKDRLLPAARKGVEQALYGYDLGRFAFMDVLDARRSEADIEMKYLDALKSYHQAAARLDYLTTQPRTEKGALQ